MKWGKLCLIGFLLVGCGRISDHTGQELKKKAETKKSNQIVSVACQDEGAHIMSFTAKGDRLTYMKQSLTLSLDRFQITEDMNQETISTRINEGLQNAYGSLKGVSVSGSVVDGQVKVDIEIDFSKASITELVDHDLLVKGLRKTDYVSFNRTLKAFQASGYDCESE